MHLPDPVHLDEKSIICIKSKSNVVSVNHSHPRQLSIFSFYHIPHRVQKATRGQCPLTLYSNLERIRKEEIKLFCVEDGSLFIIDD